MNYTRKETEYYCHSCDNSSFYLSEITDPNSIHFDESCCPRCGSTQVQSREIEVFDRQAVYDAIDAQMERLGWTYKTARTYLTLEHGYSAYGLLNDQQLIEFLRHLESHSSIKSPISDNELGLKN